MSAPTASEVRQWGLSLGLPCATGRLNAALVARWNREHPDRQYQPKPASSYVTSRVGPDAWGSPETSRRGAMSRKGQAAS